MMETSEKKVIPLRDEKTYPKYRMLYAEVERIFLEADISVVEGDSFHWQPKR